MGPACPAGPWGGKTLGFTPGPWAADLRHGIVTADGGRVLVCDCQAPTLPRGECYQAAEDARLIASAPALLAACEEMIEAYYDPQIMGVISPTGSAADRKRQSLQHARDAIAAARGS